MQTQVGGATQNTSMAGAEPASTAQKLINQESRDAAHGQQRMGAAPMERPAAQHHNEFASSMYGRMKHRGLQLFIRVQIDELKVPSQIRQPQHSNMGDGSYGGAKTFEIEVEVDPAWYLK